MIRDRRVTRVVNWALDNLLPPVLRDSRLVMWPAMALLFGRRTRDFMEFKERAPGLDAEGMRALYARLEDAHLDRETSLTTGLADEVLAATVGETVLDAGCGRGWLTRRLAARGLRATGMDIVPPPARPGEAAAFVPGSIEGIPFPDGAFDTVVSTHALEHVQSVGRAIAELRRVARRRLVLVVPCQRPYRYTFDLHLHFFPYPHTLRQRLGGAPLRCELVDGDLLWVEDVVRPTRAAP